MLVPVYNINGEVIGERELRDSVFGVEPNVDLMHQALVRQLANARLGTHSTKTRGEVSGGGKKPWRQKGLGRARHGSIRSPIWRGGGIAFGPRPRGYTQDMPKKMRRAAVRSALSIKVQDGAVTVVDSLEVGTSKTREFAQLLSRLNVGENVLLAVSERNDAMLLASRNLPKVKVILANYLNVRDLLNYESLVLSNDAVDLVESWLEPAGNVEAEATA